MSPPLSASRRHVLREAQQGDEAGAPLQGICKASRAVVPLGGLANTGAVAEGPGSSSIDTDTSSSGGSSSSSSGDHTRGSSGGVWSDCSPADPPLPHAESRHHRHRVWLS
ncbi:hypothetical protein D9Q98_000102 [Chlorella vulgaris]|uniref:Uncharacterized protein n=1 Tax=Chlorella vulgaris TaxID=3077 RepID=A0A9D4TXJ9_CHLVU|nr:hypothetical protein D9Q98_000102 [Chlorella vulgaris]